MTNAVITKDQKQSRVKGAVIGCTLACVLAVGGALAYLTDTETVTNKLSVDTNFAITLTEPAWVATDANSNGIPDAAENLAPLQTVAKDPTITCTGTVDGYVAMQVKMPVFTGKIINAEGKVQSVTDHDLYNFTPKSGWTKVGTESVSGGYRTYTFVYDNVLAQNQKAVLFDNVQVVDLAEGIAMTANQIDIVAYGIQAEGFTTAQAAYAAYTAQAAAGVVAE